MNILKIYKRIVNYYHLILFRHHSFNAKFILINSCSFEEIANTNPNYSSHLTKASYHLNKLKNVETYCQK